MNLTCSCRFGTVFAAFSTVFQRPFLVPPLVSGRAHHLSKPAPFFDAGPGLLQPPSLPADDFSPLVFWVGVDRGFSFLRSRSQTLSFNRSFVFQRFGGVHCVVFFQWSRSFRRMHPPPGLFPDCFWFRVSPIYPGQTVFLLTPAMEEDGDGNGNSQTDKPSLGSHMYPFVGRCPFGVTYRPSACLRANFFSILRSFPALFQSTFEQPQVATLRVYFPPVHFLQSRVKTLPSRPVTPGPLAARLFPPSCGKGAWHLKIADPPPGILNRFPPYVFCLPSAVFIFGTGFLPPLSAKKRVTFPPGQNLAIPPFPMGT